MEDRFRFRFKVLYRSCKLIGNAIPAISLLVIDLDLCKFNFNIKMLDLDKSKILTNIKTIFSTDFEPTILAS